MTLHAGAAPTDSASHGPTRRAWLAAAALLAGLCAVPPAAQAWPDRPIPLIMPYPAGGSADNVARGVADEMSRRLGQPVVVENSGGASGSLGAQRALRAAPDGHTLLLGTTTDMVVTPVANRSAGYAPEDFTPIALVGMTPVALVARSTLGAATPEQLVARARAEPGRLALGVPGVSSFQAFAGAALQDSAGVEFLQVPYKGGAPLMNDLIGGQIDMAVMAVPGVLGAVRAGRLDLVGILNPGRMATMPDLPAISEGGAFGEMSMPIWVGLAGPRGMPPAVVEKLNATIAEVLADEAFNRRRLDSGEMPVAPMSAEAFGQFLAAEAARYRQLLAGMKLD